MIRFVPWSEVGSISVSPGDNVVEVGSFELAQGADTLWVRMTNTGTPGPWPWSYGILSFKTEEGQPLGSVKAYNSYEGEVFRLGVGLAPSVRSGVLTFEPRGFNMAWIKQGNPWSLKFEAQSGGATVSSSYWNRDPVNDVLSPRTSGDDVDLGTGNLYSLEASFNGFVDVFDDRAVDRRIRLQPKFGSFIEIRSTAGSQLGDAFRVFNSDFASKSFAVAKDGTTFIGGKLQTTDSYAPKIRLRSNGSAVFEGPITATNLTMRSSDPELMRDGTYVGPELDLVQEIIRLETLVQELYLRLKMTPESGWPVWDGNEDLIQSNITKARHI